MTPPITYRAFQLTLPLRASIPVGSTWWNDRPVVLLRGEDQRGNVAWGEAAPLDGYGADSLEDVLRAITSPVENDLPPSLACALGSVVLGLKAAAADQTLGHALGGKQVTELRPAMLSSQLDGASEASVVKLKVRSSEDASHVARVLREHPHLRVRLDGNRQLTKEACHQLLDNLGELSQRVDFFEEPFAGCFDRDHRAELSVPVAIDESLEGDNWRHADVVVIKPSLMGDPVEAVQFARRIQESGRRVVVSSAFESAIGMTLLTWLAAFLGDAAPGLGTYRFIADDLGGRSTMWDGVSVPMDSIPAVPHVSDEDLHAALSAANGQDGNALVLTELTIPSGSWLNQ